MYGETSFELVDQMIKSIEFSGHDTFVDLGSGMSVDYLYYRATSCFESILYATHNTTLFLKIEIAKRMSMMFVF